MVTVLRQPLQLKDILKALSKLFMHMFQNIGRSLFILFFLAFSMGCFAPDAMVSKDEENEPAKLMEEGLYYLEGGHYLGASQAFQKIVDRYPYSIYCTEAELKLADSLYLKESYDEALDAYHEFQRLHPKNKNIPYVVYQKGMCSFSQVSTLDRDQMNTLMAKEEFERLAARYPDSEYADQAHWKIRECYVLLAKSELYVGHYYFRRGEYKAAMGRFLYVLENYPDLGQYHEALEYIAKCKEILAQGGRKKPWYY